MTPKELQLKKEKMLYVMNTVLNPPREFELPKNFYATVNAWNLAIGQKDDEQILKDMRASFFSGYEQVIGLQQYDPDELEKIMRKHDTPEKNEPYDITDVDSYIIESIDDLMTDYGYSFEYATDIVLNYSFVGWVEKPDGTMELLNDVREKAIDPRQTESFQYIRDKDTELLSDPRYMTNNDKRNLYLETAQATGKISPLMYQVLTNPQVWDEPEEAKLVLEALGLSHNAQSNPIETLAQITTTYSEDLEVILDDLNPELIGSNNMGNTMSNILEDDPMKIMPVFGREKIAETEEYYAFRDSGFDIDKTIEENVKSYMKTLEDSEGMTLDPNYKGRSSEEKFGMGEAQRLMIENLNTTEVGKAYKANPSPETLLPVFQYVETELYENYADNVGQIMADADSEDYRATVVEGNENAVTNLAYDVLWGFGISKDAATTEDINDVMTRMSNYRTKREFINDPKAKHEIINAHIARVESKPFKGSSEEFAGQKSNLETLLMSMLDDETITAAQYRAFAQSSVETQDKLVRMFDGVTTQQQAFDNPEIMSAINAAVKEGEGVIGVAEEDQLANERASLNSQLKIKIFEDLQKKGIITEESAPEFIGHLQRTVINDIANRTIQGGGIDDESEIQAIVADSIAERPVYDINEADFQRQLAPTEEDVLSFAALPPGVSLSQVARPTPAFDVSAFTPELQQMAFEEPELAGFIQQQMQVPGFESEWQQAAKRQPRRDRGAELDAQEDRLQSFEAALHRAFGVRGDMYQAVETARFNLNKVQASGTATEADITAAESQLREAETAMQSAASNVERASAAHARAKEQYDRETGAAFPVYETYTGTRYDPKTQRVVEAERARVATGETATTGIQQAGFLRDEQNLKDMTKMLTTTPMTQQQFFEKQLPGFQKRFEASPFFTQQQERLKKEEEVEKRRTEADERAKETQRRSRLRSGGAMTVFGRRE